MDSIGINTIIGLLQAFVPTVLIPDFDQPHGADIPIGRSTAC